MKVIYDKIAKKIEELLKKEIKDKGLIDTGALYRSIDVVSTGDGSYIINAEYYFVYLDEPYELSSSVYNSQELADYISEVYVEYFEE